MSASMPDLLGAKREASTRYLGALPDVPQFAALTTAGMVADAAPTINVHAVGLGSKTVAGKRDPVQAVRFYVVRKVPNWMLSLGARLPDSIGGIPTDVIESPPASFAAGQIQQRLALRPVRAGASIAHPDVGAGTLGAICRREPDDGTRFALSNNHVLSNLGRGKIGDDIVQPGPLDRAQGAAALPVARLVKFEPLLTDGSRNQVDAALAEFLPGMGASTTDIIGIGRAGSPGVASEGTRVVKSGRTTEVTRGVVVDANLDVQVPLGGLGLTGSAVFEDVLRIEGKGKVVGNPGDSGALFLTDDEALNSLGLLFATGAVGGYALACKIGPVLTTMGVVIA